MCNHDDAATVLCDLHDDHDALRSENLAHNNSVPTSADPYSISKQSSDDDPASSLDGSW